MAPDQPIPVTEVVDVPDVAEVDSQEAQRVWAQVLQQATQTNKRAGPAELLAALKQAEKQRAQQQQAAAAAAAAQQAAATQGASAQGGGIGGGAGDVSGLGHNNHSSPASNNNALHIPAGGIPALYRVKGAVDEPEASTASLVTQEGVVMKVDF